MMPRPLTVLRDLDHGHWEMVTGMPDGRLRPHVSRYVGWYERRSIPVRRRELPTQHVPVVISFGDPIRLFDAGGSGWSDFGSFASGAYDSYVLVETAAASGIQIDFTLLGARLFLGRPLHDLRNRGVSLGDLFGDRARQLTMELYDAPGWDQRFDILDREIGARLWTGRPLSPDVLWTWRRIVESRGQLTIGSLAVETGRSRKHLIAQFKEHIGLAPKVFARVLRFGHAVDGLKQRGGGGLADIAADCGYYDQAHFDRDFREFAGVTPSELVRTLQVDGGFTVDR